MTTCIACRAPQPRASLSPGATTLTAAITAITFAASGAAPTTLYHHYQEVFGLTPFVLTIIFGAYVLSLLGALLTVGSLSDYIGRRPAILAALALNVASMIMFIAADSAAALIAARAVQGFATGLATATLGAAIMDHDKSRGPVLNSITAFIGLTAGSLGGGALVTYAPDPQQLVYAVLLALSAAEAMPTAQRTQARAHMAQERSGSPQWTMARPSRCAPRPTATSPTSRCARARASPTCRCRR